MQTITTDFLRSFDPQAYLDTYYPYEIGKENQNLLEFYHQFYSSLQHKQSKLIEVGGGPTVWQLISASRMVNDISFTDLSPSNLEIIREFIQPTPPGRWIEYIKFVLKLEGKEGSKTQVNGRADIIKEKIHHILQLDIKNLRQIKKIKNQFGPFDIVSSTFCIDSITVSYGEWKDLLANLNSLLCPMGRIIMSLLGKSREGYQVGDHTFPAVFLDQGILIKALEKEGFIVEDLKQTRSEREHRRSYGSLISIKAVKT